MTVGSAPLVSVILTTYGRPALLDEALRSVLAQTITDLECLVVDDASPEGPPEVPGDARIRLVARPTNGGLSAARNTGIATARGRYVTFLDDDDLYAPQRLAIGLDGLRRAPIALCWSRPFGGREHPVRARVARSRRWGNRVLEGAVHDRVVDGGRMHLGQVTLERRMAPMFDERLKCSEGFDWWIRATADAAVATVPAVGYLHRRHGGPRITARPANRLACRRVLLEIQRGYFASHPRAMARQWMDMGEIAEELGDHAFARSCYLRSLRMDPAAKTAWKVLHLARSLRPSAATVPEPSGSGVPGRDR